MAAETDQLPAGGGTTGALDTTGASLIVVAVSFLLGATGVTDSKGNTYTLLEQAHYFTLDGCDLYACEGATVGSGHTWSVTNTDPTVGMTVSIAAFSGVAASGAFDASSQKDDTFVASIQLPGITPSEDNELVVCAFEWRNEAALVGINQGFTISSSDEGAAVGSALAFLVQTTAALADPTYSLNDDTQVLCITGACFRAA